MRIALPALAFAFSTALHVVAGCSSTPQLAASEEGDDTSKKKKDDGASTPAPGSSSSASSSSSEAAPANPTPDTSVDAGGADASPLSPATFPVAKDACDGAHCNGGYDGTKKPEGKATADKLCEGHGFPHASDFAIGSDEPGGRFCSWKGTTWGCDKSCAGCNPIASVTCVAP